MQFSWRLILAPWAGAAAGWLAGHGLALTSDQVLAITVACAGAAVNAVHLLEQWLSPKSSPAVTTIVKSNDPAKKPPGAAPPGAAPPPAAAILLPLLLTAALCAGLQGCAALGLAPAQSADESIAYGYGLYTGVESALSASVAAGQITKTTATVVDERAGQARSLLDAAHAAESVNPTGAASDLATAMQALEALQAWLNNPTGSPPQ